MKNKKGFTLVELLAVIVVLAIIMVIATTSVNKTIIKTRTQAFEKNMDVAVKNAKRILTTEGKLTSELLKDSLDYDKNEYDYDVVESPNGGYLMRIISDESGKFKNVDFDTITHKGKYIYIPKLDGKDGKNAIGLKINENGIIIDSTEDDRKILKNNDDIEKGCKEVTKKNVNDYVVGDEISFCNNDIIYKINGHSKTIRGKSEDFNVISVNENTIILLAQHNLITSVNQSVDYEKRFYELQTVYNYVSKKYPIYSVKFSDNLPEKVNNNWAGYWANPNSSLFYKKPLEKYGEEYPADVYDENSAVKSYVDNYVNKLSTLFDISNIKGRLIKKKELENLGCTNDSCSNKVKWLYEKNSYYWTATAEGYDRLYYVGQFGNISKAYTNSTSDCGIRPVIEISKSELQ